MSAESIFAFSLYSGMLLVVLFVFAYIVKLAWNFTMPGIAHSLSPRYHEFEPIGFRTAFGLTILVSLVFGGINACPATFILVDNANRLRDTVHEHLHEARYSV